MDSICCGKTIDTNGLCGECFEPTGAIQFEDADGSPVVQFVNADGHLKDAPEWRSEDGCCNDCFVTSHDVQRGHVLVAVPEGCGDEDCDCHQPQPYCQPGKPPTIGEIVAGVAIVLGMFLFGLGLTIVEGAAK